ncbi:MAG: YihY family inner membrane protein [Anaerolineae bacterium]|nr:YihY family inner membrane protein [Anaerolineae bacterium]
MDRIGEWLDQLYLGIDRHLKGWPTLLVRTGLAFDQDEGAVVSRSIAYYALFSLFPLLLVLISAASSILADEEALRTIIELFERTLPISADLARESVEQALAARGTVNVIAGLGLLWSATGVFTAMYRAVNKAWGNPKSRLFLKEKLFGLAVVLIVGLILLGSTLLSTAASVLQKWDGTIFGWQPFSSPEVAALWGKLSTFVPPVISVVTFIILYRTIPLNRVTWRDVWLGGLIAGLIWEAARQIYAWYLANVATYSLIYGSVGVIIGFLLWAYLSAMILLIGAEFTAQHTAWRKAGRPVESAPLSQWMNEWSK